MKVDSRQELLILLQFFTLCVSDRYNKSMWREMPETQNIHSPAKYKTILSCHMQFACGLVFSRLERNQAI